MLTTKRTLFIAIICLLLVHEWETCRGDLPVGGKIDCGSKCKYRCSKASRHKMCRRACNACCHRCNCVPPGTSGNEDVCPCYANMTTHGGKKKCP